MKPVIQLERTGCGIASVAALAGVSYTAAMRAANRMGIYATAFYFLLVFGAGFLLGIGRVLLVVPMLDERAAELIEMLLMPAVIVATTEMFLNRDPVAGAAYYAALLLFAVVPAIIIVSSRLNLDQNSGWCGADAKGAAAGTSPALPRNRQFSPSLTK